MHGHSLFVVDNSYEEQSGIIKLLTKEKEQY